MDYDRITELHCLGNTLMAQSDSMLASADQVRDEAIRVAEDLANSAGFKLKDYVIHKVDEWEEPLEIVAFDYSVVQDEVTGIEGAVDIGGGRWAWVPIELLEVVK